MENQEVERTGESAPESEISRKTLASDTVSESFARFPISSRHATIIESDTRAHSARLTPVRKYPAGE